MFVRYHTPFATIETLQRQLDQLFTELPIHPITDATIKPAVELKEDEQVITLKAQLPGINTQELEIQVTRESVSIAGEYRAEEPQADHKLYHSEFRYGKFERVIPLPAEVQNDQVRADYKDGILTLTLPKTIAAQNKVVKVNLTDTTDTTA